MRFQTETFSDSHLCISDTFRMAPLRASSQVPPIIQPVSKLDEHFCHLLDFNTRISIYTGKTFTFNKLVVDKILYAQEKEAKTLGKV